MERCGFRMGGVHFLDMSNQYHEQPIQKPTKILWWPAPFQLSEKIEHYTQKMMSKSGVVGPMLASKPCKMRPQSHPGSVLDPLLRRPHIKTQEDFTAPPPRARFSKKSGIFGDLKIDVFNIKIVIFWVPNAIPRGSRFLKRFGWDFKRF